MSICVHECVYVRLCIFFSMNVIRATSTRGHRICRHVGAQNICLDCAYLLIFYSHIVREFMMFVKALAGL